MHSGFPALRQHMPFNVRRRSPGQGQNADVEIDIARVTSIWRECLGAGQEGEFLFGAWSAADMAYAPVVLRFRTYAVDLDPVSRRYADAVLAHPDVTEWCAAAEAEDEVESEFDL
jgi:glutathione S-transferase